MFTIIYKPVARFTQPQYLPGVDCVYFGLREGRLPGLFIAMSRFCSVSAAEVGQGRACLTITAYFFVLICGVFGLAARDTNLSGYLYKELFLQVKALCCWLICKVGFCCFRGDWVHA